MLLRLSANSIKLGYRCTAQKTSTLNILRLQPQSILSCDNKRFFSRERTTAHYNIKDNVPADQTLVYKFDLGKRYIVLAYAICYLSVTAGVSCMIPPVTDFILQKHLAFEFSDICSLVFLVSFHTYLSYLVLTRLPIRMYHDDESKSFTMIVYSMKKPLQTRQIVVPEKDVELAQVGLPGFSNLSYYVPKSLNKRFVCFETQFQSGKFYKLFMSNESLR